MEFKKGDHVIINGLYSGIIIRANPARDMYVVKYRHPSERKPISTMHRAAELDLVRKARSRSNPQGCYEPGEPDSAKFLGWNIWAQYYGDREIYYFNAGEGDMDDDPRYIPPDPIEKWSEVVEYLDQLEANPSFMAGAKRLEVEEVSVAPDIFLEGWYYPVFFQTFNEDQHGNTSNRTPFRLIGFVGPFVNSLFEEELESLYDEGSDFWERVFYTTLSDEKSEKGAFHIGVNPHYTKGRSEMSILQLLPDDPQYNYFTDIDEIQVLSNQYSSPAPLGSDLANCFLGYFKSQGLAGYFGAAMDSTISSPSLLDGFETIYSYMEHIMDYLCHQTGMLYKRPSPFVDDLIDDLEEAISLPADHPDYEESYHSKMLTGMLDEAIKTDAMARELGWIKKPGPKGRTEEDILRELRGENEWLAPYIERSKKKMNQNPSPLSSSQLRQKAALEAQKQKVFGDSEISSVEDIIIEEMPSHLNPNFSVLFQESPLKYKRYGPSFSPSRLALCDDRVEEPPSKSDMYFAEKEQWRTHSKRGYKRLKKPILEEIIPGVSDNCIIAFMDYTNSAMSSGGEYYYIDYMKVRNGYTGQGVARALIEAFYSEVVKDGDFVNWGKMMNEKVGHLMESMQEKYPHIESTGGKYY